MTGGQSIPMFDYYMAPGVLKTFKKEFRKFITYGFEDLLGSHAMGTADAECIKAATEKLNSIVFDVSDFA